MRLLYLGVDSDLYNIKIEYNDGKFKIISWNPFETDEFETENKYEICSKLYEFINDYYYNMNESEIFRYEMVYDPESEYYWETEIEQWTCNGIEFISTEEKEKRIREAYKEDIPYKKVFNINDIESCLCSLLNFRYKDKKSFEIICEIIKLSGLGLYKIENCKYNFVLPRLLSKEICEFINLKEINIDSFKGFSKLQPPSSKKEIEFGKELQKIYPDIKSQYVIDMDKYNYYVDFYIPSKNMVVEFLGDYYHGNPEKYKREEFNKKYRKTYGELYDNTFKRFDEIKEKGYYISYIWEMDYEKFKKEKKLIESYIKNYN